MLKYFFPGYVGEMEHKCEFCQKGFFELNSLKEHIRQHTGISLEGGGAGG